MGAHVALDRIRVPQPSPELTRCFNVGNHAGSRGLPASPPVLHLQRGALLHPVIFREVTLFGAVTPRATAGARGVHEAHTVSATIQSPCDRQLETGP